MNSVEQIVRAALPRAKLRSMRELAEYTGIATSTLCRKIRKPRTFNLWEMRRIAEKTKMTPQELYDFIMEGGK